MLIIGLNKKKWSKKGIFCQKQKKKAQYGKHKKTQLPQQE